MTSSNTAAAQVPTSVTVLAGAPTMYAAYQNNDLDISYEIPDANIPQIRQDAKLSKEILSFPQLTTYHLVELAKVKDETRRIEIATDADAKDLTVKDLRKLISQENGRGRNTSDKIKQEVQKAMKALSDLSVSEDVLSFVEDLEAIKQVYSPGKALDLPNS